MQNRPFNPGLSGHEPLALGSREHRGPLAPATRHVLKLGVLGAPAVPARPPHPLRQYLAVYAQTGPILPDWSELRALIVETAEAA